MVGFIFLQAGFFSFVYKIITRRREWGCVRLCVRLNIFRRPHIFFFKFDFHVFFSSHRFEIFIFVFHESIIIISRFQDLFFTLHTDKSVAALAFNLSTKHRVISLKYNLLLKTYRMSLLYMGNILFEHVFFLVYTSLLHDMAPAWVSIYVFDRTVVVFFIQNNWHDFKAEVRFKCIFNNDGNGEFII